VANFWGRWIRRKKGKKGKGKGRHSHAGSRLYLNEGGERRRGEKGEGEPGQRAIVRPCIKGQRVKEKPRERGEGGGGGGKKIKGGKREKGRRTQGRI